MVVASLLAWWAQASPALRPGRLLAGLRPSRTLLADTPQPVVADTGRYKPSRRPKVRPKDRPGSRFSSLRRRSPLVLPLPSNVKENVTFDDSLKTFNVEEKVGKEIDYRDPSILTYKEYEEFERREAIRKYYREKANGGIAGPAAAAGTGQAQRLIPKIYLGPIANRIFGGSYVDIRPAGSVTIKLGWRNNTNENPALTLRQQSVGDFLFEQNMNVNLTGQIGTKLKLVFNYDTKASFDFENQMKFDYSGEETDIIRKLDLGNVSLPLNNSLVQGGQNLFGAKIDMQFGRLAVTTVAARAAAATFTSCGSCALRAARRSSSIAASRSSTCSLMTCSQRHASSWTRRRSRPMTSRRSLSARRCFRMTSVARSRPSSVSSSERSSATRMRPPRSIRATVWETVGPEWSRRSTIRARKGVTPSSSSS